MPYGVDNRKFRILSMDGGGIYGMFTNLMLKDLTESVPGFLDRDCVDLFAGTSAGAINACLMARHRAPADGLDEAIRFWGDARVYANSDSWKLRVGSAAGHSPYFGTDDYRAVLHAYFGEQTLGDLEHAVVVVTWDWAGEEGATDRRWRPRIYSNFPADNPDRAARLVDVAFMAGAPSWFRCIYEGRQDGGWVAPNPAMYAVTNAIQALSRARGQHRQAEAGNTEAPAGRFRAFAERVDFQDDGKHYDLRQYLSVFSLGVGARKPFLPVSYANWGLQSWMAGMWNPYLERWVSPLVSISLDAPSDAVDAQCSLLLDIPGQTKGFFRLNPQVLETPVMDVLVQLRENPLYLEQVIKDIHDAMRKPATGKALRDASHWLRDAGWLCKENWRAADAGIPTGPLEGSV